MFSSVTLSFKLQCETISDLCISYLFEMHCWGNYVFQDLLNIEMLISYTYLLPMQMFNDLTVYHTKTSIIRIRKNVVIND